MTTVNAATSTTTGSTAARASLTDNFETFLTLLTAQLQNQDPLSPLDTKDFTAQLVQFSGVEQQLKTNDLLTALTDQTRLTAGATAVSYLGKEAVANTNVAGLSAGGTAEWTYELPRAATNLTFRVLDSQGRTVATGTGNRTAGEHQFTWDGKDLSGRAAPAGTYSLQIDATGTDGNPLVGSITQRGLITGVDLSGAQPTIQIGGAAIPLSAVRSIKIASN
jgi:flagellar basal-body rod modification protein FlgD